MVDAKLKSDRILTSLKSAMNYLQNSMQAFGKADQDSFSGSLWHATAELEYALFLFSIVLQEESSLTKWKPNPELKKLEVGQKLVEAENLLKDAVECAIEEKLHEAYENALIARHYLFIVHEELAKKKREALKKK